MRDLQESGLVSFGLHSHSHRDSTLDLTLLEEETRLGINLFQEKLGYRPRFFAYPYGVRTPQTDQVLAEAGFEKLFCSQSAYVHGGFVQGRFDVYKRNQELAYFKLTAAGLINNDLKRAYRGLQKENRSAQHPV
jgi:peptidoglycan/xylan/chitin deacetylase (PgdA/CDA1 family)